MKKFNTKIGNSAVRAHIKQVQPGERPAAIDANATPKVRPHPPFKSLAEILREMNAERQSKRERFENAERKAPQWAQGIVQAEQAATRVTEGIVATMEFAETTGHRMESAMIVGYNLYRGKKLVLRGRPLYKIVEYLGAQHIWKDFSFTPQNQPD